MRWFLSVQFDGYGVSGWEPISLALASESGQLYSAVRSQFDWSTASRDVHVRILPHLGSPESWKSDRVIQDELRALFPGDEEEPELWAYHAAQDWSSLCWLFRTTQYPLGISLCLDIYQFLFHAGIYRKELKGDFGYTALDGAVCTRGLFQQALKDPRVKKLLTDHTQYRAEHYYGTDLIHVQSQT